jgi:hypothetical protein
MREAQFGSLHWVWVAPSDGFFLRASAPEKYQGYSQYSEDISGDLMKWWMLEGFSMV